MSRRASSRSISCAAATTVSAPTARSGIVTEEERLPQLVGVWRVGTSAPRRGRHDSYTAGAKRQGRRIPRPKFVSPGLTSANRTTQAQPSEAAGKPAKTRERSTDQREERAALKERAAEMRAEGRRAQKAAGMKAVLDRIAQMRQRIAGSLSDFRDRDCERP